jgi:hypothetical protein
LLADNEQDTADIFVDLIKGSLVITDTNKCSGYRWDAVKCLWVKGDRVRLRPALHDTLVPYIDEFLGFAKEKLDELANSHKGKTDVPDKEKEQVNNLTEHVQCRPC